MHSLDMLAPAIIRYQQWLIRQIVLREQRRQRTGKRKDLV